MRRSFRRAARPLTFTLLIASLLVPIRASAAPVTMSGLKIPASDGAFLAADVHLPGPEGTYPAIVQMTPYNRTVLDDGYLAEGYAKVNVDVRGTGQSEGAMCIFCDREQQDVYEVVQWIAGRPWSDGKVALIGGSYEAITALLGAAKQPPALKAIVPIMGYADPYRDIAYHNGMYTPFFMTQWLVLQQGLSSSGVPTSPRTADRIYQVNAPIDVAKVPLDGALYHERAIYNKYDRITVPTLLIDGWFDGFARGAIWNFQGIAAQHKRLIMQPFGHKGEGPFSPLSTYNGAPPAPGTPDQVLAWFDRFLKGLPNGIENEAPMTYFDLGARTWRTAATWPAAGATLQELYLSGEKSGSASSLNDGSLVAAPPSGAATYPDYYIAHPAHGPTNTFARWGELAATPQIYLDQRPEELTSLTYTTAPLAAPLGLAGPLELRFWAQTDAPDTDFVVRVCDVAPDGASTEFTVGFMRASHREVDPMRSKPAEPWISNARLLPVQNEVLEYRIDIWHTAYELQPGHRLRITISSGDVPNHDPTPYLGRNALFHDAAHPAKLIMTVL